MPAENRLTVIWEYPYRESTPQARQLERESGSSPNYRAKGVRHVNYIKAVFGAGFRLNKKCRPLSRDDRSETPGRTRWQQTQRCN